MARDEARFCRDCGTSMQRAVPEMEDRERAVCPNCGFIDYVNPINVVGTVPVWGETGEQILLCRRNIEPRKGFWTLPAGFMEVGETALTGALRETWEEAGARVEVDGLFSVLDVVHAQQVHLYWRVRLLDLDFDPGPETIECRMFSVDELPWEELSFLTVIRTLEAYVADRRAGEFTVHYGEVGGRGGSAAGRPAGA